MLRTTDAPAYFTRAQRSGQPYDTTRGAAVSSDDRRAALEATRRSRRHWSLNYLTLALSRLASGRRSSAHAL